MNRPILTVAGQASEVVASDGSVVLNVPITLRQRSGRRVVAVGGPRCESGMSNRIGLLPAQCRTTWAQQHARLAHAYTITIMCLTRE